MSAAHLVLCAGLPPRAVTLSLGSTIAGRSPEVDLELPHVEISRQHCRFLWDGEICTVEDLASARGTFVNGERIDAVIGLRPGDQIALGPVLLEFKSGEAPKLQSTDPGAAPSRLLVHGVPTDRIVITAPLVLGRDPQADVMLPDPAVSRRHAEVRPQPDGGFSVTDLHSTAGTFANGLRFDEHELTVGDRLQTGPFCLQFDGRALVLVTNVAGGSLSALRLLQRCGDRHLLDDLTLAVEPSRFVGIIGPSGAGKSTLLQTLAGLRPPTSGAVLVDGRDLYASKERLSLGFVPQEDIVHPELTVREALRLSARLRLPGGTPRQETRRLIHQTLDQLRLGGCTDVPIWRLSGGQRKRVNVGVELLAKPSILFFDEPTSGLDPATESQLMQLLRDLADRGCTIICTTHVLENAYLMDQLVVLTGGCLAFHGTPKEARQFFNVSRLAALYERLDERPPLHWKGEFEKTRIERLESPEPPPAIPAPASKLRRPWALPILLQRQWAILKADWRNFLILLGQPLVIAALVSWVSEDRALLLFFAYLATLWFGCSNAAQKIVEELPIYRRERLIGVGPHAYLGSKFLFLTTITLLQALLLYGCVLWFEGKPDGSIAWQVAALAGTAFAAIGIGCAISALSRSVMQAIMIVPLILIPMIVFSGYTVPASDMEPPVLRVSRLMPTFSAQPVMDTSFLWQRELSGDVISDHGQSYRNLDPERDFSTGDVFNRFIPAAFALLGHALWAMGGYVVAWLTLRCKERG
ncbi:MAG: FHA domain-containing protein [Verrucomicrobiota bacterium]|nr:FHA domain-containing protein [Verrucomicrobiota bacterium]